MLVRIFVGQACDVRAKLGKSVLALIFLCVVKVHV
jgi:hypothetical protein